MARSSRQGLVRRLVTPALRWPGRFTDRYPFFGPSVWMLAVVFFIAQVVVAYSWKSCATKRSCLTNPSGIAPGHPYSFFANTISDLGETAKFTYGSPTMWSPHHSWMNAAFLLLGLVMIIGSPFIYQEFNEGDPYKARIAGVAFTTQALGGLGVICVAGFPENEHPLMHEVGAGLAIAVGTLGVFLLGFALPLPKQLRRFMLFAMPVALVAIALYALHEYLGFGPGGMERLAAYPEVIWLISFGFYISHSHHSYGSAHRALKAEHAFWVGRIFGKNPGQKPLRLRLPAVGGLPRGKLDVPYEFKLIPIGGTGQNRAFIANQEIAPGLRLGADGRISGIPTKPGLNRLTVKVAEGDGAPVRKNYALRVER
jgi:hypothetical membrane protein